MSKNKIISFFRLRFRENQIPCIRLESRMLRPTLEAIKSRGRSLVTNRILIKWRNVSGNWNRYIDTALTIITII